MSNSDAKIAFVAYASKEPAVSKIIFDAVRRANSKPIPVRFEPWEFNDVPGTELVGPILGKISESPFVVADITTLNLNVVYEVGFAIGRGKRVFLIRHRETDGDKSLASEVGIFDTLGYHQYSTVDDLQARLTAHIDESPLPLTSQLNKKAPIYTVDPPVIGQAEKLLVSRMKKAGFYSYRSFNADEDLRLSATDAIQQISQSSGVFLALQGQATPGSLVHNIRIMFAAGLAHGMEKPTLIIAPSTFTVPLDIRDVVRPFKREEDIINAVADFCPSIVAYNASFEPASEEPLTKLQSLTFGDPRAENEMPTLGRYYLKTHEYERALKGEVNLVVGRKGSGKTALWISVRDKTRQDKRNIVVDLRPDGYQLIKLKEEIFDHLSEGAREHLITAFWEYLILLEVAYKLLEKDQQIYRQDHELYQLYGDLADAYKSPDLSTDGDFAERLSNLSQRIVNEYRARFSDKEGQRLTTAQVTELLYSHDLRELRRRVSEYLEFKKSVWVLFDNLDRGWSTQGFDALDAIVLRCLVDAGRKLEREMRRDQHDFHCIIFIRNDVYDHLMRHSTDYGKEMRATLDWSDPDLLKEMLRLRLAAGIEGTERSFDAIWRQICVPHYQGEETFAFLTERSLMRPRNIIKILSHCRGFATSFRHERIEEGDIEKGLKAYSTDITSELDRELTDVFPEARDLLYHFLDAPDTLSNEELKNILKTSGIEDDRCEAVVDFLLYYGILGVRASGSEYYIYTVNYDSRPIKIRLSRDLNAKYIVNPAFWPELNITRTSQGLLEPDEDAKVRAGQEIASS